MLFFEPFEENTPSCTVRFIAKDGEQTLGTCALLLQDGLADITACRLDSADLSVGEGLFRAALNYAGNRGFYMAVCSAPDAQDVRSRMAFVFRDGQWCNDIPTLLMGSCGGH